MEEQYFKLDIEQKQTQNYPEGTTDLNENTEYPPF